MIPTTMAKFIKAVQIGSNVTDIMNLPCVQSCMKANDRHGMEWLIYRVKCGSHVELAEETDYICQDQQGGWHVLDKEMYREMKNE